MNIEPKRAFLVAIAAASGLVILFGYFFTLPALISIRTLLLNWAITLSAVAMLIGIINLISVHFRKVFARQKGAIFSAVTLGSLFTTLIVGLFFGPTSDWSLWIFNHIQVPLEMSLVALLAVILIVAAIRLLYRRPNAYSLIFFFTILIVLLGSITLPWLELSWLGDIRHWVFRIPVTAGARGILLGIVLGIITTGLRVLMGADRPYED